MKGSLWELAPIVIAAAVAFGLAVGHRRPAVPAPAPAAAPAVAVSTGPVHGGAAKGEDALPDGRSAPDASVPPDPSAGPDAAAAADKRR
ncbi:MAG: hypothetical protein KGL74_14100 [Elusimicrobia bacterium]|nr:hypothetical protein [Elusimicrobiota bacterium]